MENKNQINLETFWYVLRRRIGLIVAAALILGLGAGLLTKLLVKPDYVASVKFYVNASNNQTYMTQSDLNVAKSLVDTYIEIIKSDTFLEDIAEVSGVEYTPADIRRRMSASSVSGTEIFKVTVSDKDYRMAYILASSIAEKGPTEIERVVVGGKVSVVDRPKVPTEPNSTGAARNAIIGGIAGAIAVFVVFLIREILDVTIYAEEDITDNFEYPIIGTIPNIVSENEARTKKLSKTGKYAGYGYGYGYNYGYGYGYGQSHRSDEKKEKKVEKSADARDAHKAVKADGAKTVKKAEGAKKAVKKPEGDTKVPVARPAEPDEKNTEKGDGNK